ncbi:amino acid ABC transporter substrate-binding protein [Kiloniella litopenaei]|uniref:amino acid ABC transporter substrate-binding protein n=1 Tax=Kiloniella litopenaei TaxID=1549748 RepID=UPI0006961C85|nr:amino acid ABC transporter substrate-binding protein [Kiloniella litopenaei]
MFKERFFHSAAFLLILGLSLFTERVSASTLEKVKERGYLTCGVGEHDFGFAQRDIQGKWHGFDVDFCRAVATATLGDPTAVRFVPVDSQNRITTLLEGEIDLLTRTTTWTLGRDAAMEINFTRITLYEVQGVLARSELGITQLNEAQAGTICVNSGTTSALNLADYLKRNQSNLKMLVLETQQGRWDAFFNGRCDLMTSDRIDLQAGAAILAPNLDDYVILPDVISKEPLAPAVRNDDDQWFDIVKWVINTTIAGEEFGISSQNFVAKKEELPPQASRLFSDNNELGKALGLDTGWASSGCR